MKIVGCDPGQIGAICLIDPEKHTLELHDMPINVIKPGSKKKIVINWVRVGSIFNDADIVHNYIEEVNARPGEGPVGAFTFGGNYWGLIASSAALKIPYTTVRPAAWKKEMKCPAEKDAARHRASQLMPECADYWILKKHDGRAEAALIALYGMMAMDHVITKRFELVSLNGEKVD